MNIKRSVDIENEVRLALKDYFEVYCRPLPENYGLKEAEKNLEEYLINR